MLRSARLLETRFFRSDQVGDIIGCPFDRNARSGARFTAQTDLNDSRRQALAYYDHDRNADEFHVLELDACPLLTFVKQHIDLLRAQLLIELLPCATCASSFMLAITMLTVNGAMVIGQTIPAASWCASIADAMVRLTPRP